MLRTLAVGLFERSWFGKYKSKQQDEMSALFNFQSALMVLLLLICTCTYCHQLFPAIMDRKKDSPIWGFFWKCARIGERLSPYVSLCCVFFAIRLAFFS